MNRRSGFGAGLLLVALGVVGCSDPAPTVVDAGDSGALDGAVTDTGPADAGVVDSVASDVVMADVPAQPEPPEAGPTTCNPLATTGECMLPWPSDFLTREDTASATGRRVFLPRNVLTVPAGTPGIEVAPFNRADGFPTTAPILLHLGGDVAPSFLVDQAHAAESVMADRAIVLMEAETGRRVPYLAEMDANRPMGVTGRAALFIRPVEPLKFGTRYVVALRRSLRLVGDMAPPESRGFAALRDNMPSTDARIEAARTRYNALFTTLASRGLARDALYLAWDFTTASRAHVLGPILGMRQEVFRRGGAGVDFTVDNVLNNPTATTARIVEGTFAPPNYLRTDNNVDFLPDGSAVLQTAPRRYPFTMVIPRRAMTQGMLPLVVFGHGVFGVGREYLESDQSGTVIQRMADEAGVVVIATDWIGLSGGDQALIISNVVPNINRIGVVTDRLLQSLVNNLAMIELATGPLATDTRVRISTTQPLVDASRVYYYGVSLGGIQGSSLVSASRNITRAVVSVPGGSWSNLLPRSTVYEPIKNFVDQRYPDPLVQAQFISLLQARFDHADPANLATMMFRDVPPMGVMTGRRVIVQEAIGDCLVPNLTTEILVRAMGVRQLSPSVAAMFGVESVMAPTDESVVTQFALTRQLMQFTPPSTNTIPARDNGVHSDMVTTVPALAQVTALLGEGRITHPCNGVCDPD